MERDLKEILMQDARSNGICFDGYDYMRKSSIASLVRYYKSNPDWCLERSYPSLEILRKEFDNTKLRDFGIFIDYTFDGELLDRHQVYIFHNCKGNILTALNHEAQIIPMLYFANGCDMTIGCDQPNVFPIRVPLYIFGENAITAESQNAEFKFYRHDLL